MITVLCHGTYDLLHVGHFKHLEMAKTFGDWLIVSVSSDEQVAKIKPGRPLFSAEARAYQLPSLRFVDEVFISDGKTGADSILRFRPDIFIRGRDYIKPGIHPDEQKACNEVGAAVRFTITPKFSSSDYVGEIHV